MGESVIGSNLDARGRRKSSPSASQFYSRRIHNIDDPDGALEEEINRLAKRFVRTKAAGNLSRSIMLRERLATKCLRFFYITGDNVLEREDGILHEGGFAQVDDIFLEAVTQVIDKYDSSRGEFTHMLRSKFKYKKDDAAFAAAREDTIFGGGTQGAPISLDAQIRRNDGDSTALSDGYIEAGVGARWREADGQGLVNMVEALEEEGELQGKGPVAIEPVESFEDVVLLELISLIDDFMGRAGRAANDTRKLYTRMFFSETLTRVTKLRTIGEIPPLERRERQLLKAVELPFQDSYTAEACRTIMQLWKTPLAAGIKEPLRPLNDDPGKSDISPDYAWTLPASVYLSYLRGTGRAASDVLVSQQRGHYEDLLASLVSVRRPSR